ncbi:N-(5'-phosphoribosyl)anthranilate isomerase [Clostridium saccharobutylicum]|uniref:N-(5'-phosphoribosyl)anthranilate isomerase n=3 Tax=Clostridium saccharobutylicum TaxID=169679 RepID=U5MV37_CLOSA|nr:phosphoribosylanthranilate isomerase [Clostridium saccharobutylicum]AGX43332.1 N-(5'-phosphoribosyl)anthranilate isomerase TrpF [Clostridium saccharobutylicum DSM 13864]NYF07329.1 phosphoribosylanthranilate isomerase [Clostridium saccharobutylicum]OAV39751.1 N-(5'-phosphoribosyl)anthranilate isomerase TrpF [Clostridium saccharobutylicum DSM 13864]OOM17691.1 N-(5'-phosphoribosyl)anthranilate isomerase [Clostridium saccharobutylicum]
MSEIYGVIDMIKIKICGITNKKEIEYVNILKPDYIGLVFTQSKRKVNNEMAVGLLNELNSDIKSVGVFRDNSIKEILKVISEVRLDIIQLHGKEDLAFIRELRKNLKQEVKIWKALSITNNDEIEKYVNKDKINEDYIESFLIDGANPGSGESYSLEDFKLSINNKSNEMTLNLDSKRNKFFLAGGINEKNVLERIEEVNPMGIDVSSGVEIIDEDGQRIKSFEKMKILIDKVRNIQE